MNDVTVRVPAKVNLGLAVGPTGDDGYHELVNVFHAVSLFDVVTARPADTFTVAVTGGGASGAHDASALADVPLGDGNLAARAARLLAERAGVRGGAQLHIRKSIPVAGGMAGGSADAAATLVACDVLWNTRMAHADLHHLAGEL